MIHKSNSVSVTFFLLLLSCYQDFRYSDLSSAQSATFPYNFRIIIDTFFHTCTLTRCSFVS